MAIAQGRQAAEAVHAMLTGAAPARGTSPLGTPTHDVAGDFYAECPPVHVLERPVAERIAQADLEVHDTISEAAFLQEAERCFSCGLCNGCQYCFMYCNGGGFVRVDQAQPGAYFALSLERCMGCGKCIDLCPTGFLSPADTVS
jgi:NAD-dependent dihydropyrimidine dehydrogenase PreA subunit